MSSNRKKSGSLLEQSEIVAKPVSKKELARQQAARQQELAARRSQMLVIGLLVTITAVIIIGFVVLLGNNPQPSETNPAPAVASGNLGNIPQRPFELGPADAKVVIEEYGDYQCPACKYWQDTVEPKIVADYLQAGKSVKLVFKPFPFLDVQSAARESHLTLEAAYCAADQNRFWDYHHAIYSNQPRGENTGFWSIARLQQLSQTLGLDSALFNSCLTSQKYKQQANAAENDAAQRGVRGTPTIFVNGVMLANNDYATLRQAVEKALS